MRWRLAVMSVSPLHQGTVIHAGGEGDVGVGCGVDVAAGGQNLGGEFDCLGKIPRHFE